ncbi:MAG: two-component system regulatory protein YycI [Eubacteriales bacterium]|nr:two-component system regulatory protein YycI [Eubacteriales bacterium]
MDLSKAKTIFITVFIALNIFLLVNIGMLQKDNSITQRTLDNTVSILAARGVTLAADAEIPVFKEDMPLVVFEDKQLDKDIIIAGLKAENFEAVEEVYSDGSRQLTFYGEHAFVYTDPDTFLKVSDNPDDSTKDIEKRLVKMIDSFGFPGKDFVVDISDSAAGISDSVAVASDSVAVASDSVYTFVQKHEKFLIFDNFVKFTLKDGGIERVECCYRLVKGYESREAILPAHQILINSLTECSGCEISSIKIGYKGKGHTSDEPGAERQAPVWSISFTDGSRKYYRAYDGAEI